MQAVVERVFAARLVTLTGGGGVGKTRLAIQAAAELAADFPDGVAFIELAALADPALLPGHAAAALGMREAEAAGGEPAALVPALCAWLTRHPVLLVLDNCEHLLEAAAALVHALLEACPDLRILATSRQRLGITGEVVRRVPSLTVPGPERLPADEERAVEAVLSYPAAQLFVERAAAAHAEFQVENRAAAEAVAQICGRLDGIPLALELAAARVGLLTLPQIAARLDDRFRLLTGGSRVALPRQQTLRALIDWSYELLPGAERTLLCRLSVFAGGWTLEAAEAICGDCGLRIADCGLPAKAPDQMSSSLSPIHDPQSAIRNDEVLDLLCALEEKSLVLVELREGAIRYRMLETVREYAREKLEASGELAAIRDRHRDWYLQLAVGAEPELSGMRARECLDRLEREHDNLRAALQWSLEAGQGEPAQRLAGALVPFWELRRDLSEGRQALAAILSLPEMAAADAQRARILYGAGLLARTQEDHAAARAYWTEALAIWRQLSDRRGMAEVLASLSDVEDPTTNRAAATALLEESLSLWRELEDRAGQARSLGLLARISTEQEALPAARAMYEDALALNRELGNLRGQVADLTGLAYLAMAQGDLPVASAALEEVLAIQRELGDRWSTASTLFYLGRIAFDRGDYGAARRLWEETLALDREKMGEGGYVDLCLGWLLAVDGRFETARESYEAFVEKERRTSSQTDVPDGLIALGDLALQAGDEATAQARYEESLAIYRDRDADSDWGRITLPYVLWHLARRRGDLAAAQSLHEEMLLLHQSLEGHPRVGWLLHYRGMMARCEGNYEDARSLHGQSAALFGELGQWKGLAACLEAEAGLAAAQGQMVRAARLCGAAAALRDRAGQFRIPIDRADYEATVAAVRAALDEAAIAAAWAEGQAMSLDEAAAYALEGTC